MHESVLLQEVITGLNLKKGSVVVDGTLGLGGHSFHILKEISPKGVLIGIDQDTRNLEVAKDKLKEFKEDTIFVHDNFSNLKEIISSAGFEKVDAILLDLGLSSPHIDDAERGFSFYADGPLDMRMNPEQILTAATIVNSYTEKDLADIIYEYVELFMLIQ